MDAMLLSRTRRTLAERRMLEAGDVVLVACSGGPDSVAMLDVLNKLSRELQLSLHVASVDHGLRSDADLDVACAREHAAHMGVPFHALRVHVPEQSSVQDAARQVRYEALLSKAREIGARRIAVGHTMDDQAETVLARILRGAGIEGLSGIAPVRKDGVIRPLIDSVRVDVHAYVETRGLVVRHDPSNINTRFLRTRVRTEHLPRLSLEDPAVVRHLAALADDARSAATVLRARARRVLKTAAAGEGALYLEPLRIAPPAVRRCILRLLIKELTGTAPGRAQTDSLVHLLETHRGSVLLPHHWVGEISEDRSVFRLIRSPVRHTRSSGPASQETL